jgi:hypothetical protein
MDVVALAVAGRKTARRYRTREELLEIIMRRYERASTLLTSGLGQVVGRQRRRLRHAGSVAAPRPRAQVWPAQLANQNQ